MEKMWRDYGQPARKSQIDIAIIDPVSDKSAFSQMIKSRHLKLMALVLAVSVIVSRLVDYQFNVIVSSTITDKDQLAAFLGFWMSNLNFISLMIQIFITRKALAFFGVGSSLFFLPSAVFIGVLTTLIHPALWSAVTIKLSEGCFKNSLNKSSMELLFLPIPHKIKSQAKAFIDIFVDSAAGGIGGLLLVFFVFVLDITPSHISVILVFFVMVWFALILSVKKEYVSSFIKKINQNLDNNVTGKATELVLSESIRLKTEAVRYLFHHSKDSHHCLKGFLEDPDYRIRGAAILGLVKETLKNKVLKEIFAPDDLIKKELTGVRTLTDRVLGTV